MDVLQFLSPDWSVRPLGGAVPDIVWAAAVSALVMLALLKLGARRPTGGRRGRAAGTPGACTFAIDGDRLRCLDEPARALIASLDPGPAPPAALAALAEHLAQDCPNVHDRLDALVREGRAFRLHCARGDGTALEIAGAPQGGVAHLTIRTASEEARAREELRAGLARADAETAFLRSVLDRAPLLAWAGAADGQVTWANAPYRERFDAPATDLPDHRIPAAFGHVLEEVPLTARTGSRRRRVSIPDGRGADGQWFELSQTEGPDGVALGFALDAGELVAAEGSLRRFIETLTETFAHLPIGLAVFDKNRRLGLFNPALTDLVKIDAVWLAGRPSLRDFLERLRETRQMPDQKDFASFRRKLTELEESARDGTYEETWVLPSGKVFRVTGRPHPQGALAFLFEDISTAVSLERRYRSELELSQATLDRLSEAVAVFNTSGMLAFVNSAFERMWSLEPMTRLAGPGVVEMTHLLEARCAPSALWTRLRAFATGGETRTSWTAELTTADARALRVLVAPLPDGSALVVFRDLSAEAAEHAAAGIAVAGPISPDPTLASLALAQMHLPVETAVRQLAAAIPAAPTSETFRALSAAAQGLTDGLARSREIEALAREPVSGFAEAPQAPLRGLGPALAARGLSLDFAPEIAIDDPVLRRAIWVTMLAAADLAAPGAAISLRVEGGPQRTGIAAATDIGLQAPRLDGVGVALARRVLEAAGGAFRLEPDASGKRIAIRATLPLARPAADDRSA